MEGGFEVPKRNDMTQPELEFEIVLDGYTFFVTFCTAGKNLATLQTISLCGFPIDIAEMDVDKQFDKYMFSIKHEMHERCNQYWSEQLKQVA